MIKKLFLTVCAAVMLLAISSCGKLDPLTADNFVCNPNPLVEEGGQVNATVTVTYPVKYFKKKASITITPVLEYAAGETQGTPVTFQGEKVSGNDQEISYKGGGTGVFRCSFLYKPEMATSKLRLDFTADVNGKPISLPSVYIADGVIATESLCSAYGNTPAYAADNFVKDTFDKYIATMIYQYRAPTCVPPRAPRRLRFWLCRMLSLLPRIRSVVSSRASIWSALHLLKVLTA